MSVDQYKKEIGMMNLEKLIQDREGISSIKSYYFDMSSYIQEL